MLCSDDCMIEWTSHNVSTNKPKQTLNNMNIYSKKDELISPHEDKIRDATSMS